MAIPREWMDEKYIINFSKAREWIYISCWHKETAESYAMWKIYGEHQYSICVETTSEKIDKLFEKNNISCAAYSGKVEYVNPEDKNKNAVSNVLKETMKVFKNGKWAYATQHFIKHKAYDFEKEYRAIMIDDNFNLDIQNKLLGITLKVDPNEIIENIIISPRAPAWFHDIVQDVLNKYDVDIAVSKSSLELYKNN